VISWPCKRRVGRRLRLRTFGARELFPFVLLVSLPGSISFPYLLPAVCRPMGTLFLVRFATFSATSLDRLSPLNSQNTSSRDPDEVFPSPPGNPSLRLASLYTPPGVFLCVVHTLFHFRRDGFEMGHGRYTRPSSVFRPVESSLGSRSSPPGSNMKAATCLSRTELCFLFRKINVLIECSFPRFSSGNPSPAGRLATLS